MKIRVLFIIANLEAGGAQRVFLTVLRYLDREQFEPHLCVITNQGSLRTEIADDIPVHELCAGRVRYALIKIVRLCRKIRPKVVISTVIHLNFALIGLKSLLPKETTLMVREANIPSKRMQHTGFPLAYKWAYRFLYPFADRVICNSKYMADDLISSFSISRDRIVTIPNPVDTNSAGTISPYPDTGFHCLSVGRLNYQKGFDLLLKSFKMVLQSVPNAHLTIIGEGEEREQLLGYIVENGMTNNVSIVGLKSDVYRYMAHADLFVSSSRFEGLPNVILEALACGTPVVAFDCPGGTAEIIDHGENGWLVEAGDVKKLADAIVNFSKGEINISSKKSKLLPQKFKSNNVVRQYQELILRAGAKD